MLNGSFLSNSRIHSKASYGALWIKIWPARKFNITRCDVRIYKFLNFLQVQTVTPPPQKKSRTAVTRWYCMLKEKCIFPGIASGVSGYEEEVDLAVVIIQLHTPVSFQWPCCLRRNSAAARLPRLWVRIPLEAWSFFCCECCVCCQVEVSATS